MPDTIRSKLAYPRPAIAAVAALLSSAFAFAAAVHAQPQGLPVVAQPVIQNLPGPESMRLNNALARLARYPRDVAALIEAGEAAKALGDFEAAEGFFRRVIESQPGNGRAKAGLASALVLGGNPYTAIPMFEEAERAGADVRAIVSERGLAYDLVGANALAQNYYRQALARDANGEIRRRLALSLAIGGDGAAADEMLLPLLRAQNKPAWRTRVFVLAITGRASEAVDVTNALLPADFARHIIPYLRYMPQLTPAQQAAAANLGKFPRASEVGRDDPRIAPYASLASPRAHGAAVDAALVPRGEPLGGGRKRSSRRGEAASQPAADSGRKSRANRERIDTRGRAQQEAMAQADAPRVAPPEPRPARGLAAVGQPNLTPAVELPPAGPAQAQPAPVARPRPVPVALAEAAPAPAPATSAPAPAPATSTPAPARATSTPAPAPATFAPAPAAAPASLPAMAAPAPGFDLARLPNSAPSAPSPGLPASSPSASVEPATPAPVSEPKPGFADLFGDLGKPTVQPVSAPGAVDVRKIEPAKAKPRPEAAKPPPKPAPPSHPSRIWVQLGVGRDVAALKFDWRRLNRQQVAQFKGRKAYVSDLGRTNRMLTGPFESRKAASDFLAQLAKAGLEGPHLWISPAGQVVDLLSD